LAALRREVEPVSQDALAKFLPAWQGVGRSWRGLDGLIDALGILQGAALPASVFEADILPARVSDYRPADLDALCTAGDLVWVGAGGIGSNDGRIRVAFRDQAALLLAGTAAVDPNPALDDPTARALLEHLSARGASFWAELVQAVARAGLPYEDQVVLAALWDLVWAGLVTNDSLAPLRALVAGTRRTTTSSSRTGRSGRPRPGRLARLGPPAGAGRWSLVAPLLEPAPTATEASHARAMQLLERYGVLTREAALGEGAEGGFAGVYPVLKALEERGQVRRGYFVDGLGAAQFALPGAVDRLRAHRADADSHADEGPSWPVLAATDPAQPYGASLPWPHSGGRPQRAAGAHVVLAGGEAVAYVERSGRSLLTFPAAADHPGWPAALAGLVEGRHRRQMEITRIDGEEVISAAEIANQLREAGFVDGYRGLVLRR
jgi:ATP-dependent Lhr-like helicase